MVAVWKLRVPTLSHSVESIASLAAVQHKDQQLVSDGNTNTTELRLEYSCAIIRTINGLTDAIGQNQTHNQSVHSLAHKLGIPRWLVDIRHQATHQQLPSLAVLRMAAQAILEYLKVTFFVPLRQSKWDGYSAIRDRLDEYDERTEEQTPTTDAQQQASRHETKETVGSQDNVPPSLLSNPFALLIATTKKASPVKSPRTKRKRSRATNNWEHPVSSKQIMTLLETDVPVDVVMDAVLDFLLNKDTGVLLRNDFDSNFKRYQPLVCTISRAWPGCFRRLLMGCFNNLLDTSNQSCGLWIRYLLSLSFLRQLHTVGRSLQQTKVRSFGDRDMMARHQIPIRALYHRCRAVWENKKCPNVEDTMKIVGGIVDSETFRNQRYLNPRLSTEESLLDGTEEQHDASPRATKSEGVGDDSATHGKKLTLDELEALLDCDDSGSAQKSKWQRCETWESCPIGSLPGHS